MPAEITVIIPAYNAGLHIGNAIKSVLDQSCSKDIEIIVIDDGSTDDTVSVVSDLSRTHKQVICVPNGRSKGPSGARNTGLLKASGMYIAFLDADDLWLPNHLLEGVSFLEKHNDVDIVLFNFNIIEYETRRFISDWFTERRFTKDLESRVVEDGFHLICDDMFIALINESFIHLQSMIIRRQTLQSVLFNEDIRRSEDRDFSIRLYLESKARFAFSETVTGVYYRHNNSLTSNSILNSLHTTLDHIKIYSGYLENLTLDAVAASRLKELLYNRHLQVSYCYRKINCHKLATISIFKSFRYKIGVPQFTGLAKIAISYVAYNFTPRTIDKDPDATS